MIKSFNQGYPGYESLFDASRDVAEHLEELEETLGLFTGTVRITITYEEPEDE